MIGRPHERYSPIFVGIAAAGLGVGLAGVAAAAEARGWKGHLFDGPRGWADRLVAEGLLTAEQAK